MAEVMSVITLDETEASSEKKAQVFDNFTYSQSEAVSALSDVNTTVKKLATYIDSNKQVVLKIANNYEQFTDYVQTLQGLLSAYDQATNQVSSVVNNLSEMMKTAVEEFAEQDEALQEDLEALNSELTETGETLPEGEAAPTSEQPAPTETPAETPVEEPAPAETPAETPAVEEPVTPINTTPGNVPYTGEVYAKRKATDEMKSTMGQITTGNQSYSVVPDGQYTGAPGTISQSDYNLLIAQVCGESANSPDDMLAVTCTVLNRLETGGGMGNSVREVLQKGYFPWGETHYAYEPGGKYYNTSWGQDKIAMATQVVNDALNGTRNVNSNVYYYSGDGKHNYFSDKL